MIGEYNLLPELLAPVLAFKVSNRVQLLRLWASLETFLQVLQGTISKKNKRVIMLEVEKGPGSKVMIISSFKRKR